MRERQESVRMEIASRFRAERERLGFTQVSLARELGLTRLTILNYEAGAFLPNIERLPALRAAGFDTDFLVYGNGRPKSKRQK